MRYRRPAPSRSLVALLLASLTCEAEEPNHASHRGLSPETVAERSICEPVGAAEVISIPSGDMVPLCDRVYAEPSTTAADQAMLRATVIAARDTRDRVFGGAAISEPLVLFCSSAACKEAFIGPTPAAASRDVAWTRMDGVIGVPPQPTVVVTGPNETTRDTLLHELVHVHMAGYVHYDDLPTWFNEGAAAAFSSAPDCTNVRADSVEHLTSIASKAGWQAHIEDPSLVLPTYCQSRREVAAWLAESDEDAGSRLTTLLLAVQRGVSFEQAYGPLRTE